MRSTGSLRAQALVLAATLLIGGLGLPLLDAVCFHSAPLATAQHERQALSGPDTPAAAHLLGCAVLTAAVVDRGLPAVCTPPIVAGPDLPAPYVAVLSIPPSKTDHTLSQSRAPPLG